MLKKYLSVIITLFVLLPWSVASAQPMPSMPAVIGGTVTVDGVQLDQATAAGFTFKVTKQDGTAYAPVAEDMDGLNILNWYLINIPIYEAVYQPGGANPGDISVIHVYKNGTELVVTSPADGQFTVGDSGSTTQINLEIMTNQQVPNVVGMPQVAAELAITDAGFTVGIVTEESSDTVAAGNVISQNPAAGEMAAQGSTVALVVSTGPPQAAVPNVVGMSQVAAELAITDAGFTVGIVTEESSDTVAAGNVISQNPAAGEMAAQGSTVALVVSTGPPQVAVPNVVGMSQVAAELAITDAGFTVGIVTEESSDTVAAGNVISQNPAAGEMAAQGSTVALVVSTGPPQAAVPNVVGMSQVAAELAITDAGFTVGIVTEESSDTVAAGNVISQNPAAGEMAAQGSTVALVVSTGPPQAAVPNVVGMSQVAAELAITDAGFTVGIVTEESSDTVAAGNVISQNPAAGEMAAQGSTVALVVSTGPPQAAVPNVVGMSQVAAELAITDAGFTVGIVTEESSDTVAAGNVISQNPAAGEMAAQGSTVALVVSTGPPQAAVPNVVGMSQVAAELAITDAGFTVGIVTEESSDTVAAGNVISQNPAAGEMAAQGSTVALVVSTGPPQAAVPNVVGMSQVAAELAITDAGFTVGIVTEESSDTVAAGNVISQNPAAGEMAAQGSTVALVVSTGPPQAAVPNVVGMSQVAAELAITDAGFTVGIVTEESSDTVAAGNVISQNPAGGTEAEFGASVNLVISTGPHDGIIDGVIDLPEEDLDPVMITAGDSVEFAGTGYGDPELTYLWNFGDPAVPDSNQQNPGSVRFNTPGTHTVTFTVCNPNGCDPAPDTRTIIVECHDPIPQDNLSVCNFCSEETAYCYNLSAKNAIDGDPNTLWHTEWINTPDSTFPHWIEIDLGNVYDVSGFTYLPRQDYCNNGTIRDYKFYVGNGSDCDNVEWVEVASGTFEDSLSKEEKRVCFTVTTGRFVRLEAISEVNGGPWTSAAELNVLGELFPFDDLPDGVIDLPEENSVIIIAGESVEFAGTGYGDTELTYLWNFGDPAIPDSYQQNPGLVQFNIPGTHTVTFTVCDPNGCDPAPDTRTIIVECHHDPIPQDNLSVCDFCSEETAYYYNLSAENAIDDDPNTLWHTEWINNPDSTFPHWIEIDLGNVYDVSGFTYLPRQDPSVNGTIRDYRFYVGNGSDCNNVEWVEVASGAFEDCLSKEEKRVCFTVTTGRFVRLEAISEVNGGPWTSAAELNVLGEPCIMPPE